jgi:spore coat polysaccharide biosynthesis protein SpsF
MFSDNRASGKKLVAVLACRNKSSRLYGKPLQNLDVESAVSILDNIVACLKTISAVDEVVLAISDGTENQLFVDVANSQGLRYVVGDECDVLLRLLRGGQLAGATDVFRVTSESPFMHFELVEDLWREHVAGGYDCTFLDDAIDGCGFEILSLRSLQQSHARGDARHRSELCTLYIREHPCEFKVGRHRPPEDLIRNDLRLTVDNPEDLVVCRNIYARFKNQAPRIPVSEIVMHLDKNPQLKALVAPFTELGYSSMYVWKQS